MTHRQLQCLLACWLWITMGWLFSSSTPASSARHPIIATCKGAECLARNEFKDGKDYAFPFIEPHGLVETTRQPHSKCLNLTSVTQLIDLTCHAGHDSYFDRTVVCHLSNFHFLEFFHQEITISKNFHMKIAFDAFEKVEYQQLAMLFNDDSTQWKKQVLIRPYESCYIISPETILFYRNHSVTSNPSADVDEMVTRLQTAANIIPERRTAVFVERLKTRVLDPSVKSFFRDYFENKHKIPMVVVNDSASMKEQVWAYSKASYIVGFHGAGYINAIFAPKYAIVAEICYFTSTTHESTHHLSNEGSLQSLISTRRERGTGHLFWIVHCVDMPFGGDGLMTHMWGLGLPPLKISSVDLMNVVLQIEEREVERDEMIKKAP